MRLTPGRKIIQIHSARGEYYLLRGIDCSDNDIVFVDIQGYETLSRNRCKHVFPPCSGEE
jgi:hypothetical protein